MRLLIEAWLSGAGVRNGKSFWRVNKRDRAWGSGLSEKTVWHVVKIAANMAGIATLVRMPYVALALASA
jgi:hypothetical protein